MKEKSCKAHDCLKSGSYTVGFCGQYVTINAYGEESARLLDFLCCDLQVDTEGCPRASYDLVVDRGNPVLSLWQEEKQLYSGECSYDLAYTLINEIIYQCIVDNRKGHAIHAAAIASETGAVLLPGKSGSGKSTLTTWLVSRGCKYLTDELVILPEEGSRIHAFTRPFSIKTGSSAILSSFLDYDQQEVIAGTNGFMLPHRLVNENFSADTPPLSLVLFPEYKAGAATELTQLTAAFGCGALMECYVNARNIQGHGIGSLAEIARKIPMYRLTYSHFDGLHELLHTSFPTLF